MRIEKLNNDKIRVTLTLADLIGYDVDITELSPDSMELQNFLSQIMETIRIETGFNPYNGRVVVEATPSGNGMSIVVSRLTNMHRKITHNDIKHRLTVRAKQKKTFNGEIYYFDNFDDLCGALVRLSENTLTKSSLYKLNGVFCYILREAGDKAEAKGILLEFSSRKSYYPLQLTYITEHGELVAQRDGLVNMAENIKRLV